ncbi:MAG TPA: FmdE family protein [Geobacteraceae bacterium]|nr:FmdE family protein [Geobacteraceae bacterium]
MVNYDEIVRFHGHECPGLAIGYRMSLAAMAALGADPAGDEELVAIVENDACGVDALQMVSGCTFGKGNLVFRDYGKQVYTLFSRSSGRSVRVLFHGRGIPAEIGEDRMARAAWILAAPEGEIISTGPALLKVPTVARVRSSVPCAVCGEPVMEGRLRQVAGREICIPCAGEVAAEE